jgi:hypothetical protein
LQGSSNADRQTNQAFNSHSNEPSNSADHGTGYNPADYLTKPGGLTQIPSWVANGGPVAITNWLNNAYINHRTPHGVVRAGSADNDPNVVSVPLNYAVTPKLPPLERDIATGEIIGWRAWRVVEGTHLSHEEDRVPYACVLKSCTTEVSWVRGVPFKADAKPTDYDASGFAPGVHAWKKKDDAVGYSAGSFFWGHSVVVGEVELWGEVVEHEDGYRAEYTQIKSIYGNSALADRVREFYGVPASAI